jgi:hypothetical protein
MKKKYVQIKIQGPKYVPLFCLHLSASVSAIAAIAMICSIATVRIFSPVEVMLVCGLTFVIRWEP